EPSEVPVRHGAFEALEQAPLVGRVDADPVVADLEEHVEVPSPQADLDRLPGPVLRGVPDQVVDQAVQAVAIPVPAHAALDGQLHRTTGPGELLIQARQALPHQYGEVDVLALGLEATPGDAR